MSEPAAECDQCLEAVENGIDTETSDSKKRIEELQAKLKAKTEECEALKTQNIRLESDLIEANGKTLLQGTTEQQAEVHKMKEESEELLTRAKSIIFEKTKVCKNQELQIEALNAQVSSLKDVVSITKNLLEIRNIEVKHLQDQIDCMNAKVNAEKERQDLVHQKLEKMIRMNADLKREYETQLCLFNALRERYSERELARNVLNNATNGPPNDAGAPSEGPSTAE